MNKFNIEKKDNNVIISLPTDIFMELYNKIDCKERRTDEKLAIRGIHNIVLYANYLRITFICENDKKHVHDDINLDYLI